METDQADLLTGTYPHQCPHCGRRFKKPQGLGRHLTAMHGAIAKRNRPGMRAEGSRRLDEQQKKAIEEQRAKIEVTLPHVGLDVGVHHAGRVIGTLRLTADGLAYRRSNGKRPLDDVRIRWDKLEEVVDVFRH